MFPSRRPLGSASGIPRLHGPVLALLIGVGLALPSAHATQAKAVPAKAMPAKATNAARASSAGNEPGSNLAKSELIDIADLRKRMTARTVTLTRHAEMADIAIQVWARTTLPKKYYVAVTQQGTVRRTLTANDEAEAWRSYDSFRRMAGLGEVGRPVLLGQMTVEPGPTARVPVAMAVTAMPGAPVASLPPLPPLPPPPPVFASAAQAVQPTPIAAREISATTGETVESRGGSRGDPRVAGYEVETLRRARFGDEVARLVWSVESSQYFVSLTRQGSVVAMLRSRDSAEATRAYEDYVRQAEKRAALLQGRTASPMSSASR